MTPRPRHRALSLEELELWLASDRAPAKGGWNVSAVDGLIAGIVAGPAPVEPAEWTRLIFGARPLGEADCRRYEEMARRELGEACARWLATGVRLEQGHDYMSMAA